MINRRPKTLKQNVKDNEIQYVIYFFLIMQSKTKDDQREGQKQ